MALAAVGRQQPAAATVTAGWVALLPGCCADTAITAHRRPAKPACPAPPAPPAGVLFALEEATSTWSHKLAWRCFLCTSFACFTLAQLHPRMQSGMLSFHGIYPLTNLQVRQ